jgi:hypothetical protein
VGLPRSICQMLKRKSKRGQAHLPNPEIMVLERLNSIA